jgi:excisionase family DNA binding protein
MPDPEDDELYKPREVAAMFGVTTTTIALWVRTGRMTCSARTPGGHRRFRESDIQVFQPAPDPVRDRFEDDAVRLYEQGWSIRQVAERFDVGHGAMRRILLRRTTLRNGMPSGYGGGR